MGAYAITFLITIILARLLEPELYGTLALVTVFITILQVFVDSGLGNALIQKKNADDNDFTTVFYTNLVFCFVLYVLAFFVAPLIAAFYHDASLVALFRVLSLIILISGVKNVQQAYVSRNMLFKRFFFSTLIGTMTAAVVGIVMALQGFGIWALVSQMLVNAFVDTCVLWLTVKWRPRGRFSLARLRGLYSYGWKLLASNLLTTVYKNVRQLIIGKLYSAEDLAYYNRSQQFPNLIISNVNTSIDSILFPVMSDVQYQKDVLKRLTRRAIKTSVYLIAPIMMGMAFTAPVLIEVVLTEKWLPCVPFLRVFCIFYLFYPIHTANLNAIKALGRSDIFLELEIAKKIVEVTVLVLSMWHGVMVLTYSMLFTCVAGQIINAWPNKKLMGYSYREQLKDILPDILLAVVMGLAVSAVALLKSLPLLLILILQVILGAAIYIGISMLCKNESLYYLLDVLRGLLPKKQT